MPNEHVPGSDKPTSKNVSIGTKLTEADAEWVEHARGAMSRAEFVRNAVLAAARPGPRPAAVLLEELLTLRAVILTILQKTVATQAGINVADIVEDVRREKGDVIAHNTRALLAGGPPVTTLKGSVP